MQNHTVQFEKAGDADKPVFAPVFNAVVPFIDRHIGEGRSGKIAIFTDEGQTVTYGELFQRVNRAGNALLGLGVKKGDRVLMIIKDAPEFHYTFWGAIKAGLTPVPLNTLLRAKDYKFILEDSAASILVHSPEYAGEVDAALAKAGPGPAHAILTEGPDNSLEALMDKASAELEPAPAAAGDDCFWLYSSGSTGPPKGAVHRHKDMVVAAQNFGINTLGIHEGDLFFSAAKLFFAYGLGNGMYFPLWVGAAAVLSAARPTPQSTFAVIENHRPTLYFGVPTLYAAQLSALDKESPNLSSLRVCVSAGEALPGDIQQRWLNRTGLDILDGIGSTEALHIFICNRQGQVRPGSSGRMVPGYEARIVGDQGREAPDGEAGVLQIRGDTTARIYWNNPEKTSQTMLEDGWMSTGDTYYRDGDGYYYYCGRNDDMLKVGGIWCSPFEIESKLIEDPRVLEAAVVGQADAQGLIKPAAYVVLKEQSQEDDALRDDLLQLCKKGLAPYKYPRWINFVATLPKTATGKIQRFRLRDPGRE